MATTFWFFLSTQRHGDCFFKHYFNYCIFNNLEECLSGYELDERGECVPCQRGFFRSRGMPSCQQCVTGKTTPDVAATSEQECMLGKFSNYSITLI